MTDFFFKLSNAHSGLGLPEASRTNIYYLPLDIKKVNKLHYYIPRQIFFTHLRNDGVTLIMKGKPRWRLSGVGPIIF